MATRTRRPGRPRKAANWVDPRERLLRSAEELFYRNGISATGIDQLLAHAGVAKMSMYAHFGSKDRLTADYMERIGRVWWAWFDEQMARGPADPVSRLVHVFELVAAWVARDGYCGCAFINAAAQLNDTSHPAYAVAVENKVALRARLERMAREAGLDRPKQVARELSLLIDGALVAAAMERSRAPAMAARQAAARLLDSRPRGRRRATQLQG
ncbi:MAG TPA: TetR/AcrR family transcriptional regulator [Kofleriaceae bacterium]|nr:TetR/AcrR family transcriptional regulator [Kofleriaceae bacterium]